MSKVLVLRSGVVWDVQKDHADLVLERGTPREVVDLETQLYVRRANQAHLGGKSYTHPVFSR